MDSEANPQPAKLWVPPSYQRSHARKAKTGELSTRRYRRSLLTSTVVIPVVTLVALWLIVAGLGDSAERVESTIFCGFALALCISLLAGGLWPVVHVDATHLSWFTLPRRQNLRWEDVRSVLLSDGAIGGGRHSRVPVQWIHFLVHDPARSRDRSRYLSTLGLPRREFLLQAADIAEASNPACAASLREIAENFNATGRLHAIGSSKGAYCCAALLALASGSAALATLVWS